jgi:erythromycin esterase
MWTSIDEVLRYIELKHPRDYEQVKEAYGCLLSFEGNEGLYGTSTINNKVLCDEEVKGVVNLLEEKVEHNKDPNLFWALGNARVVSNAERYYYATVRSATNAWNVRDGHMMETLANIVDHEGPAAKVVIWQHNTHAGDARATSISTEGMISLGQLARSHFGPDDVYIVGFGSYTGTVAAASAWGEPLKVMRLPLALPGTWEDALHNIEPADKILLMDKVDEADIRNRRGHRSIGVTYDPLNDKEHYIPTLINRSYDAFIYLDETRSIDPLPSAEKDRITAMALP